MRAAADVCEYMPVAGSDNENGTSPFSFVDISKTHERNLSAIPVLTAGEHEKTEFFKDVLP